MRSKRPPNLQKTETDPSIAVVEISDPPFHRIPLRSVSRGFNNSQQETQEKKKEIIFFLQAQVWSPPAERTSSSWQSDPENKPSVDQCSPSSSQEVNRCVSNPRWRRPHISSCFLSLQTVSLLGDFRGFRLPVKRFDSRPPTTRNRHREGFCRSNKEHQVRIIHMCWLHETIEQPVVSVCYTHCYSMHCS